MTNKKTNTISILAIAVYIVLIFGAFYYFSEPYGTKVCEREIDGITYVFYANTYGTSISVYEKTLFDRGMNNYIGLYLPTDGIDGVVDEILNEKNRLDSLKCN